MFKGLSSFVKSSNGKWILVIIVVLFIIWALMSYSSSKGMVMDNMYSSDSSYSANYGSDGSIPTPQMPTAAIQARASSTTATSTPTPAPSTTATPSASGYALAPVANPSDLLPKDKNSQWAALNPVNNQNPIVVDLLQAGNLIGLDTIGQTLKNANLQLRSDPIIVKQNVGPWNQSTFEADLGRVPLELGCGQP